MYFHTFQGNFIPQSEIDQVIQGRTIPAGYVNVTAMAQASSKNFADYLRLKGTNAKLEAVQGDMGIPISDLIIVIKGGDPTEQGSWAHHILSIDVAQWCSVKMWLWATKALGYVLSDDFDPNSPEFQEVRHQAKQAWNTLRTASKDAFFLIGDEIKAYLLTDKATENDRQWLYANCQNAINRGLFGKSAIEIKEELGIGKNKLNRDHYNAEALMRLERVQFTASKFIAQGDHPLEAIEKVLNLYSHPVMDYRNS